MTDDRPWPVALACGLAMGYGLVALGAFLLAFGLMNPANLLEAIIFPIFLFLFLVIGVAAAGIFLAGLWAWRGSSRARWALVTMYLLAACAFTLVGSDTPLLFVAAGVNVLMAVGLVVGPASDWFI